VARPVCVRAAEDPRGAWARSQCEHAARCGVRARHTVGSRRGWLLTRGERAAFDRRRCIVFDEMHGWEALRGRAFDDRKWLKRVPEQMRARMHYHHAAVNETGAAGADDSMASPWNIK
jgi:hypothetical protein